MSATLFSLHDLSIRYSGAPGPALAEVTLEMREGERLALIGESGSGKTTLARALGGLLPPGATVAGDITWPKLGRPRAGRDIGFVFQEPGASLDPVMRVGRQLGEVLGATRGLRRLAAEAEALELLGRVLLPDPPRFFRAFPHELSGGQKQRVGLALALAARPKLLIADEPTSALDTIVQAELIGLVDQLVQADGMALVLVTHDLALAARLADQIAVLKDGRVVEWGATEQVIRHPNHAYTRTLLGSYLDLEQARA